MSWFSKNFRKARFQEPTTWAGIGGVFFGLSELFAGAGTTTPAALETAGQAASQVADQVSAGLDPVQAVLMTGLGLVMASVQTRPDYTPPIVENYQRTD